MIGFCSDLVADIMGIVDSVDRVDLKVKNIFKFFGINFYDFGYILLWV